MFGFTRQAYYKDKINRVQRNSELIQVRDIVVRYRCSMPRIGTRKLYFLIKGELNKLQINIGRDALFKFLRAEHLLIKPLKRYVSTTNSKHWMRKYPNIIKDINISGPEQLWVSDITYIKTENGFDYLSLITDAYSKKVMGYHLNENLSTIGPLKALQMAISMTENGYPYENALAERMNGILKYEFLLINGFKNHLDAVKAVTESVGIYNSRRPHLTCNMLTPNQMHIQNSVRLKKWKKKTSKEKSSEVYI